MAIHAPIALVDMDGTLCDYAKVMKQELATMASPGEPDGPWIRERELRIKNTPGFWRHLPPLATGFAIVRMLQDIGFTVSILTKGPQLAPIAWSEKLEWVTEHFGRIPLTITQDKSLVYGRVLVDDWPDYISGWLSRRPRGLVICPDQPWNQEMKGPNIVRADDSEQSWKDIQKALQEVYNRP